MQKLTRKRFIKFICYFVAVNLCFAPLAHASMVMLDGSLMEHAEMSHPCDNGSADLEDGSSFLHKETVQAATKMDCDHDVSCKILCSITVSALHQDNFSAPGFEKSTRWFPVDNPAPKSSFLFRLERPPRI